MPEPALGRMIPLKQILVLTEDVQIRTSENAPAISEYMALLEDEVELDPILVVDDGDRKILSDGFTRYEAYRRLGRDKIPCQIIEGTLSHALEHAISRNGRHGCKLTRADKRKAVSMALKDARLRRMTDTKLARMCGVSAAFVAQIRTGKEPKKEKAVAVKEHTREAPGVKAPRERPDIESVDDRIETVNRWMKEGYLDLKTLAARVTSKTETLIVIPNKNVKVDILHKGEVIHELAAEMVTQNDAQDRLLVHSTLEEIPW